MNKFLAVVWLSWLIVVLALFAAAIGLFYQDGESPFPFTMMRAEVDWWPEAQE